VASIFVHLLAVTQLDLEPGYERGMTKAAQQPAAPDRTREAHAYLEVAFACGR